MSFTPTIHIAVPKINSFMLSHAMIEYAQVHNFVLPL